MSWVQFHAELGKGAKRGLSRATRYIYMELSLEARVQRGVIDLRADVDLAAAIHDLLGGNRTEIDKALPALTSAAPGDRAMLEVSEGPGWRQVVVVSWEAWNSVDHSTDRVRKHRADRKKPPRALGETRFTSVTTVPRNVSSVSETVLDQSREDKSKEERERDARVAAPPPPKLSDRGVIVAKRLADPMHGDVLGRLTKAEIATAILRLDENLRALERLDWWTDPNTEVDSWVSFARSKGETLAWTPLQYLGAVEGLGRTRCRERPAKARIERERRRADIARTGGVVPMEVLSAEEEIKNAEKTFSRTPAAPPPTAEERQKQIADIRARIGSGGQAGKAVA